MWIQDLTSGTGAWRRSVLTDSILQLGRYDTYDAIDGTSPDIALIAGLNIPGVALPGAGPDVTLVCFKCVGSVKLVVVVLFLFWTSIIFTRVKISE